MEADYYHFIIYLLYVNPRYKGIYAKDISDFPRLSSQMYEPSLKVVIPKALAIRDLYH